MAEVKAGAAPTHARPAAKKPRRPSPVEDKVHCWPYLVKSEFICSILMTALLMVWSIALDAPMEDPSNPAQTPNPSKAPWYFLGLQEMLVYFDPWLAGVIFPQFIITGLMILPYIDVNPRGNGYYSYKERKFAINTFLFGFILLWVALIEVGVFLRGPGWNFFAPWQNWDPHLVVALTNVDLVDLGPFAVLSQHFPFRIPLPAALGGGYMDLLGGYVVGAILMGLPLFGWLAANQLYEVCQKIPVVNWVIGPRYRDTVQRMGLSRYAVTAMHFAFMVLLPFKMVLRWTFNLKYLWVTPWFKI